MHQKSGHGQRQAAIQDTFYPLFKKPMDLIGKQFKVPGSHWGSSAGRGEANKLYVCAILDFSFAYREKPDDIPCQAFKLSEQGEDGHSGNSVDFWMQYPTPMLKFYYETYPEELELAKNPPSAAANAEQLPGQEQEGTTTEKKEISDAWKYVKIISSSRVAEGKQKGRTKHICKCNIEESSVSCNVSITVYGSSTSSIFKHIRCHARRAENVNHIQVMDALNKSSSRKVQLSNGDWVTVLNFEESFPHHLDFCWLVAGGLPMRLNRRAIFLDFIRGFEPRAVMPHNETIHRIVECVDEIQQEDFDRRMVALQADMHGLPCIGGQLDLWTDRNSGICYAAFQT